MAETSSDDPSTMEEEMVTTVLGAVEKLDWDRGEQRQEKGFSHLRIRNPNDLSPIAVVQKRAHHPVLDDVLPLKAGVLQPGRPRLGGDQHLAGAPAVEHADVEAAGEIVEEEERNRTQNFFGSGIVFIQQVSTELRRLSTEGLRRESTGESGQDSGRED
ncbi:hypothetical protein L484_012236 [Morus notabilis]|uniref:Uncharacterized protein n=1 Tax=Morus notabilis TaxID=981085 RepID=W9RMY1_9ROSA|nr:hypothetical protein L484_012236 [Morus notabilis]